MAPGAPHIALRCPVSKEARGPWRPGLPGPVPFCPPPSRGGVALTLSPPRGIASPPRKIFPIFFPQPAFSTRRAAEARRARGGGGGVPPVSATPLNPVGPGFLDF